MKNRLQVNSAKYFGLLLLMVVLFSCKSNAPQLNREEDKEDAEKVTNQLFEFIKTKKFDESFKLFGPEFYKKTSKDRLMSVYIMISKQLGTLKSVDLEKWETKRVEEGPKPLGEYLFEYTSHYEKADAYETIRLAMEKNGAIRIISYNVNSNAFK